MRATLPLAALVLSASVVALPTAVAECDVLSRSLTAGATVTVTHSECSASYSTGTYGYHSTQNQTSVAVSGMPLGLDASATLDEGSHNAEYPGGSYAMDSLGARLVVGSAGSPMLVADAGALDHSWRAGSSCSGETRATLFLFTDAAGSTYLVQSIPSGDAGGVLSCSWNDLILS